MVVLQDIKKRIEKEKAVLVGVLLKDSKEWEIKESLEELAQLAESAGAEIVYKIIVKRDKPTPAFYIGKGKVDEIAGIVNDLDAKIVIFDNNLTPAQERNLQKAFNIKVLDRTELIMDIFAQRAHSKEAKLQTELAQLEYMLPRLTRMWTHLSRQVGGIGTRGPGEKQLEVDKRRVRERIFRLKKELEKVKKERDLQRKQRIRKGYPLISLVGYTNAGKSTLFNSLTGAYAYVKNQLFSTLMPLTRQVILPNNQKAILSDTVGFINKLPHQLVEAFKATLEEVVVADLLIHVMDVTSQDIDKKYDAVMKVLDELKALNKPIVVALNKVDLSGNKYLLERIKRKFENSVLISAKTSFGIEELMELTAKTLGYSREFCRFKIPHSKASLIEEIYENGHICEKSYKEDGIYISAEISPDIKGHLKDYILK